MLVGLKYLIWVGASDVFQVQGGAPQVLPRVSSGQEYVVDWGLVVVQWGRAVLSGVCVELDIFVYVYVDETAGTAQIVQL